MKTSKRNLCIYIIGLAISILLLGLYFIDINNPWCIMCCSIGASGVGAVILAWLIEDSNNRRLENEKKTARDIITSPIINDLTQIICIEALIAEKESEEFKQKIQNKTLTEIVEELEAYHLAKIKNVPKATIEDFEAYDEDNKDNLENRLRALRWRGGLINYATDDIYFNRSYNISYELFTDNEIEHLKMIQINLSKMKNAESFSEYTMHFLELIAWIDCYDKNKSLFKVFNFIKKNEEGFVNEKGRKILLVYEELNK